MACNQPKKSPQTTDSPQPQHAQHNQPQTSPSNHTAHNNEETHTENPRPCPLRRLANSPPSSVLQEFTSRASDMPPEHAMLMQKFQSNEQLRSDLDGRFAESKEELLVHLWETHKHMFRPLSEEGVDQEGILRWIEGVRGRDDSG